MKGSYKQLLDAQRDILYKFGRCIWASYVILYLFLVTAGMIIVGSHEFVCGYKIMEVAR